MPANAKKEEKKLAKSAFVQGLTKDFRATAEYVGVSERTVSKWAKDDDWEGLREAQNMNSDKLIRGLYAELEELDNFILTKPEGHRFADAKQADARRKIVATINDLRQDISYPNKVAVAMKIDNHIAQNAPKLHGEVRELIASWLFSQK